MDEYLIPIITAIIGLIGGLSITLIKERFLNKRANKSNEQSQQTESLKLAKELLELEFERAKTIGLDSPYSTIAHLVVLEQLINKQLRNKVSKNLMEVTEAINDEYIKRCWPQGYNHEAQLQLFNSIRDNKDMSNPEVMQSLKILLNNEIQNQKK